MSDSKLYKDIVRLAHENPSLRASLMPVIEQVNSGAIKVAREDVSWGDGNPSAPKTPWGPAQGGYKIMPGVWWYSTAGHGGMGVSKAVAMKHLSGAAMKMGDSWGGAFWYEEDAQYAIPLFEKPEWQEILARKGFGRMTPEQLEATIRRWNPRYFQLKEQNVQVPTRVKVGDKLKLVGSEIKFVDGFVLEPGDEITITKVTRARLQFRGAYTFPAAFYDSGRLVKV